MTLSFPNTLTLAGSIKSPSYSNPAYGKKYVMLTIKKENLIPEKKSCPIPF